MGKGLGVLHLFTRPGGGRGGSPPFHESVNNSELLYLETQGLLVYWSHRSQWPRATTKWGPPNFTHLVLFFFSFFSFWQAP